MNLDQKKLGLGFSVLWLGLIFSFWDTLGYSYVNYDDPAYLLGNPLSELSLLSGAFWEQLWTTSTVNLWHPLTVLSHQIMLRITSDWGVHHGFNIFLHGTIATLWGVFLYKVTKKPLPAIVACLLYAWHPVTVESVAWLSGRKDLLCGLFIILSFLFHLSWADRGKKMNYILSLTAGCLAMLCKPIAFLIPVILLLLDFWPLQRKVSKVALLKEKLPWLIPAVLIIFLTLIYQSQGGQAIDDSRSLAIRGAGALWASQHAITSSIIPIDLHLGYADPELISPLRVVIICIVLLALLAVTLRYVKQAPYLFIGILIFIVFLSPTIGLIRAGNHLAADRYCYLPLLGLSFILAGALANRKTAVIVLCSAVALGLLVLQKKQVSSWESLETLSQHALKIAPNNPTANAQMGLIHFEKSEFTTTLQYLEKTLTVSPEHAGANLISATIAKNNKDWMTAEKHYRAASITRSNDILIWYNLAHCLIAQQKNEEGIQLLEKVAAMSQDATQRKEIENDIRILRELKKGE